MIDITKAPFFAPSDGITDATTAMQLALASDDPNILLPEGGAFAIQGVTVGSGKRIHAQGATVSLRNRAARNWIFQTAPGAEDVQFHGGAYYGDPTPFTGLQWSIPLRIDSAQNVLLSGLQMRFSKTDLCWIGGNTPSEHIRIQDCTFQGAMRNALSVVNAGHLLALNCRFEGTTGNPGAGVDVEPNAGDQAGDINFVQCEFNGNVIGLYMHSGLGQDGQDYLVARSTFSENAKYGLVCNSVQGASIIGNTFSACPIGASIGAHTEERRASRVIFAGNHMTECPRGLILAGVRDSMLTDNIVGRIEKPVLGDAGDMIYLRNS